MTTLVVRGPARISGAATVPGDKSIAHRALMVAAAAEGTSRLSRLPAGEDVASTARCLESFGVRIARDGDRATIDSPGIGAWAQPREALDCGNSGTTMRVLSGLAARRPDEIVLDGDDSLRRRPMERVAGPLRALGAVVELGPGGTPPLRLRGGGLTGRRIEIDVASAQVKSCLVFAGLGARGETAVVEPARSRDHTERMLDALGVPIRWTDFTDGRRLVEVMEAEVPPLDLDIAGDPSSAAFLVAAALLSGEVTVSGVGLNPTRIGFLEAVGRMGADVSWEATEDRLGEPAGTVRASRSSLGSTTVDAPLVPALLDELPLLAVLATQASGATHVFGAAELRVKETDRIAAIGEGLRAMGARVEDRPDGFVVEGPTPLRGAEVDGAGDHRIAMALAVAGLCAEGHTRVRGWEAARISWPGFEDVLRALGADVEVEDR